MNTSGSLQALRRANPRRDVAAVATVRDIVDDAIARDDIRAARQPRRRRISIAAVALALAAGVVAFATIGPLGGGRTIENAHAAVAEAVAVSAASAERSGTAVVSITHDGHIWAGSTIRWHDDDLSVLSSTPQRGGRPATEMLVVDGMLYAEDGRGGWIAMGSENSIDPDSGATPDELLAAIRADTGGATLRRIVDGMAGLRTHQRADGSTEYSGTVAAGLVARETGLKGGEAIRVLPFGYVAHDQAADPRSPLEAGVTVDRNGVVREIDVRWGTWDYTVSYRGLGATPALVAPENPRPLRER